MNKPHDKNSMQRKLLFFSVTIQRRAFKDYISNSVGITATTGYGKYLGLPTLVGDQNTVPLLES